MKEIIMILTLLYLAIYLGSFIYMYLVNSKYVEYILLLGTIIAGICSVYYIITWDWLAILWVFNTIMSSLNTLKIYKANKSNKY